MGNNFNYSVDCTELSELTGISELRDYNFEINKISDGNIGATNSICAYVKGKLPNKYDSQIVLAQNYLDGLNCIIVEDPKSTLNNIIAIIERSVGFNKPYIGKTNYNAISVGKNCVIEDDVYIGSGTIIEHNVVIHNGTYIGRNCIIRSGSVIGGSGYGFTKTPEGLERELFIGVATLGDRVEVGYNCTIARGLINETRIEDSVKLDNLVHIAHDCHIETEVTITAGVSLCGYVHVGAGSRLAPNSTVKQRLSVGKDCVIGLGAVVTKNVPDNDVMIGNPAKSLKRRSR